MNGTKTAVFSSGPGDAPTQLEMDLGFSLNGGPGSTLRYTNPPISTFFSSPVARLRHPKPSVRKQTRLSCLQWTFAIHMGSFPGFVATEVIAEPHMGRVKNTGPLGADE